MNATRWLSLTEFTKYLGKSGICHVEDNEKGWFVTWIDNSPRALARAESNQKKERGDIDDETRQRKLIAEQIERAKKEGERRRVEAAGGTWDDKAEQVVEEEVKRELVRDEGEKVQLNLSFKMKPTPTTTTTSVSPPPTSASPPNDGSSTIPTPPRDESCNSASPPLPSESVPAPALAPIPVTSTFIAPPPSTSASLGFVPKPNPFKANPLKRPNPLKSNPLKSSSSTSGSSTNKRPAPLSAVEAIFQEEMAKKARMNGGGSRR